MKREGSTFTITNHSEVIEYFYSPTNWDYSPGNKKIAAIYIAYYHYHLSESYVEENEPTLEFESEDLEYHWDSLCYSVKYAEYSFTEGKQLDISDTWHSEYRDTSNKYLIIANYIFNKGFDNFQYTFEHCKNFSKVVITNRKGLSITIKDSVDLEMYLAFRREYDKRHGNKDEHEENKFMEFIAE